MAWRRKIQLRVVVGDSEGSVNALPSILADENAIRQAFAVVIENAVKYSVEKSEITVSGYRVNNVIAVYVDNLSKIPIEESWCDRRRHCR